MMILAYKLMFFTLVVLGAANGQSNETNDESPPIMAELGKAVVIPCQYTLAENETVFSLLWKYGADDIAILGGNLKIHKEKYKAKTEVNEDTDELTLKEVQFDDAGDYSCDLITSEGSASRTVRVKVFAVPEVSTQPHPVVVPDDYEATRERKNLAECKATGGSLPFSMKWVTMPENDLVVGNSFRVDSVNSENKELTDSTLPLFILPDPERNNRRQFACVVEDAIGRETFHSVRADVTVFTTTPPTTTMQASPMIVSFPAPQHVKIIMTLGETHSFNCDVTGVPAPNIVWYKGLHKLAEGVGQAVLTLTDVTFDETGKYTCVGKNKEGDDSRSFNLVVEGSPVITVEEKWVNDTEEIIIKPEENVVSLSCEASAFPLAEISWSVENMNMSKVIVNENLAIDGTVVISTVNLSSLFHANNDRKRVKCVAVNSLGTSSKEFIISTADVQVSSAGLIVGVVVAIMVVVVLVFIIVYFTLQSRRRGKGDVSKPENAEKGCLACAPISGLCGGKKVTKKEKTDGETKDEVKEVREEGTKEEKQKLTEAEEQPAEKESNSEDGSPKEDAPEEGKQKKKLNVSFPLQCCSGNKKQLKEEDSINGDAEATAVKEEEENTNQEKVKAKHADSDSGKGDTLEKVVD